MTNQLGGWAEQGLRMVKMKIGTNPADDPRRVAVARKAIGDITELSGAQAEGLARLLKSVLQKYDALFSKPLAYVMAMHQRPPEAGTADYHFHIEFYPPNRSGDKLKMLAGSELGAGAFILDARAEDTAKQLREIRV